MTTILEDDRKAIKQTNNPATGEFSQYKQSSSLIQNQFVTQDQVTVVIPALNEEKAIGSVIDNLKAEGFFNIIVVDGYSEDLTVEVVESKGARVIAQHGVGKAGAISTALDYVSTPYLLVMDGDCTYKASDIRRLMAYAHDYDEVIGARTNGRKNIPRMNRLGNWVISKIFKILFDKPITDVLSGMYMVKTEKLRAGGNLTTHSFDIEVEIACSMASHGNIVEVPISYGTRVGKQKLKKIDAFRILSTLLWMGNFYNPALLYGAITSLAIIPGIGVLGWVVYEKIFFGQWHLGAMLAGVMLFLFASQGFAFSTISLLVKRSERRVLHEIRSCMEVVKQPS